MLILKPYLPGKGPTLHIDLSNGIMTAHFPHGGPNGTQIDVFEWSLKDYSPGMGVSTDLQVADDILSFAIAYAEDPEQFEREPDELEQISSDFWAEHGGSFTLETSENLED